MNQPAAREVRYRSGMELLESPPEIDSPGVLIGYAAVYGVLSEPLIEPNAKGDLVRFVERIHPGAFGRSIARRDVHAYWDHFTDKLLGRTSNGTLELVEDGKGLRYTIHLPDISLGRDAAYYVARRDVFGASLAFVGTREEWNTDGPIAIREVYEGEVLEVSPCKDPAYLETSAALRSLDARVAFRSLARVTESRRSASPAPPVSTPSTDPAPPEAELESEVDPSTTVAADEPASPVADGPAVPPPKPEPAPIESPSVTDPAANRRRIRLAEAV